MGPSPIRVEDSTIVPIYSHWILCAHPRPSRWRCRRLSLSPHVFFRMRPVPTPQPRPQAGRQATPGRCTRGRMRASPPPPSAASGHALLAGPVADAHRTPNGRAQHGAVDCILCCTLFRALTGAILSSKS